MDNEPFSTWLEIDLGAIKKNISLIKSLTGTRVMAVVKANGYGHGMLAVAKAAVEAGVEWLGVARIEEALTLRSAGVDTNILVLGYVSPESIQDAIQNNITVTLYDIRIAESYAAEAKKAARSLKAHLKIETGMGRLGMLPDLAGEFLNDYKDSENLDIEGIFTHFACADEPNSDAPRQQLAIFNSLLGQLQGADLCPKLVHTANSASVLNYPDAHFDMVRPGIAIYGLDPSPASQLPKSFRPALVWKTRLTSVSMLPPGHGVSYGSVYVTEKEERIGVIPVGYGDGFRRISGQQAIVRGKRVDVVGRVCMDQCMLQLDSVPDAAPGDVVVLIGQQGGQTITANDLAAHWGTINYEVVCGLANRLPRLYYES